MAIDSDSESISTLSEMTSINGNVDYSSALPKWIINERMELKKKWNELNEAMDGMERKIVDQTQKDESADSFEQSEEATQVLNGMRKTFLTSTRHLKKQMSEAAEKLNGRDSLTDPQPTVFGNEYIFLPDKLVGTMTLQKPYEIPELSASYRYANPPQTIQIKKISALHTNIFLFY